MNGDFLRLESFIRLVSGEERATILLYKGYRKQLALIVPIKKQETIKCWVLYLCKAISKMFTRFRVGIAYFKFAFIQFPSLLVVEYNINERERRLDWDLRTHK